VPTVKIEFFKGGGKFTAHIAPNRVLATGVGSEVAFFPTLQLNSERYYIALTARSDAAQVRDALSECETAIDCCIADLSLLYSSYVFNFPVYRGFVVVGSEARGAAYVRLENPVSIQPPEPGTQQDEHAFPGYSAANALFGYTHILKQKADRSSTDHVRSSEFTSQVRKGYCSSGRCWKFTR
jgi:hypothetical protein